MNSKKIILLLLITIGLLTSCSDDNDEQLSIIEGVWHIKNISGGLAGINDTYTKDAIKWTFNNQKLTLTIVNNNPIDDTIYDGYASGVYHYSILESNHNFYLVIEDSEFGEITLIQDNLTLDGNKSSVGNGADLYILELER